MLFITSIIITAQFEFYKLKAFILINIPLQVLVALYFNRVQAYAYICNDALL
jgi:hypothetical protein